jgi:type I restriction enzyme M protein
MAIKKSQLYSSIWKSCDELRGGMDASQYKDYVLVLLFIKYISDRYAGERYAPITIPQGSSFKDMVALKGKPTIGDDINKKIIAPIAEANQLSEMPDFNNPEKLGSGSDMVKRLSNLIAIFENPALDFSKNRAEGDDILGDAYEYLMKNFATESGKSKGQFYTPAEVSRVIAKTIGIATTSNSTPTVYDPTCGSGSLLLKVADETDKNVKLFGQEMDNATAALARMNMILHNNATAVIARENTLSTPLFKEGNQLKTFDFVIANPPFSFKSWSNGVDPVNDVFGRFQDFGIPPTKNGDYAFLLHIIRSLRTTGKGACILPHGVLFRGNTEAAIRTNIIQRGYIKGIIGLPPNLFYGTGIPACIVVLDKENAQNRKGIFMIDASKGFVKDGNKNRLRFQDIHKIVDTFNRQIEVPKYSRMVSVAEIEKNEFNLNIPRYIDSQEPEDIQDIEAHLKGDIPNQDIEDLQNYWSVFPTLKASLFDVSERKGYLRLKIPQEEIKHTIFSHPEYKQYAESVETTFATWKEKQSGILKKLTIGIRPKQIINSLSEDVLSSFDKTDLIDRYDIYQRLMEYWSDTMQDDMYQLAVEGWKAELSAVVDGKKGK